MLLISVPAVGYLVGAGAWIALRAVGVAVERMVSATSDSGRQISLRMTFMFSRLFLLAVARRDGRNPPEVTMSNTRKVLLYGFGFYLLGIVLLVILFGFGHKNNSFQIQNEFKLVNWVSLGVFSINR